MDGPHPLRTLYPHLPVWISPPVCYPTSIVLLQPSPWWVCLHPQFHLHHLSPQVLGSLLLLLAFTTSISCPLLLDYLLIWLYLPLGPSHLPFTSIQPSSPHQMLQWGLHQIHTWRPRHPITTMEGKTILFLSDLSQLYEDRQCEWSILFFLRKWALNFCVFPVETVVIALSPRKYKILDNVFIWYFVYILTSWPTLCVSCLRLRSLIKSSCHKWLSGRLDF